MKSELTIAIVTKKRPLKLARCLDSIRKQSLSPYQILIIDNDSDRSAYPVFKQYTEKLPIHYFLEKRAGVPNARNRALIEAKTKYLGFVDDDCILNKDWVKEATWAVKKNNVAYVCGKTNLHNRSNIWALAQHAHDSYWYSKKIKRGKQTTAEHFDTKNVILNKKLVLAKNLKFDSGCNIKVFDSADFDFGLQLKRKKLKGIYNDKMRLTHEETSTFKRYLLRAYYRGRIGGYINRKWKFNNKFVNFPERNILLWIYRKIKIFPADFNRYTKGIKAPIYIKTALTVAIIIYEGAYLKGYLDFKA